MRTVSRKNAHIYSHMDELLHHTFVVLSIRIVIIMLNKRGRRNISDLVGVSDEVCRDQLRMDRATFHKLCFMLESIGGLKSFRRVTVCKKVVMFLAILAHHTKNRCVKFQFKRSGQTVSTHFHVVLHCVLKMHSLFLIKPQPVAEDSTDPRWQKFMDLVAWIILEDYLCYNSCLGALDGTYVDVHVHNTEKARYRNRKDQVSINVLGVCDMNIKFVYILTGWESFAADSRVLRNTINRENGLKVPRGIYYFCDNGYPNCDGFLTPYKGVRYHLNE
ncbi:hypothetical protein ACS0TY_013935 [Phlomoides rotata]